MERIYGDKNGQETYVDLDVETRKVYKENGVMKRITKEEWGKYLKSAGGDEIEACILFCEDEGIFTNEEQEALVRETIGQKIDIDKDKSKRKKGSGRKKTVDPDKESLMTTLARIFHTWTTDGQSKISNGNYTFTLTKDKKTSAWVKKEVKKPDETKVQFVKWAAEALGLEAEEVVIGNQQKLIYIKYNENTYKLTLVKSKGEKKNG